MHPGGLRLAGAIAVAAGTVGLLPAQGASACAVTLEQRNLWSKVSSGGLVVGMDDVDPCRMIGVRLDRSVVVSDDGGTIWRSQGTAPADPGSLVLAGEGVDAAVLLPASGAGLWVTNDRGVTWTGATGLPGPVRRVVADVRDRSKLYAVTGLALPGAAPASLPVTAGTGLYASGDGGRSFSPVPGAAGLAVTDVATNPADSAQLWLGAAGPAGGLYLSTDGGTSFLSKARADVRAVAASRLAGGGSEVVAGSAAGLLVSRDDGVTVDTRQAASDVTAVALEWNHPSALMAVTTAGVVRSADTGSSLKPGGTALPAGCDAHQLRRDRSVPSVFLLTCGDGSTWRYRSDGTDLSATDNPDGSSPITDVVSPLGATAMTELRRIAITRKGGGVDGSIAYDGTNLYYADTNQGGVVHRQAARTGADLPDLQTTVPTGILQLAYDANRNHLLATDTQLVVWDVALPGGRATRLFLSPAGGTSGSGRIAAGTMAYDAATDRLLFAADGASGWDEYDRSGHQRLSCGGALLGQTFVRVSGGPSAQASIAGIVATGDGQVYVETEDDATVLRMDRSCHVLAVFGHAGFSEASNENDSLACDTTSFATPAIWMRDANAGVMVAYEVPGGYCALPSTVTVTAPDAVATGHSGPVCATLRLRATGRPLPGLPVDLLVAGRGVGSPVTDATGVACATYVPLPSEAGPQRAGAVRSAHQQPVLAAFLGTPAYRPASAGRHVVVTASYPPPVPQVAAAAPPLPLLPAPAHLLVAPPPPPPVQPPQQPPNVPQQQPVAQGHPGAQPGAAPGGAIAPEEDAEGAAQGADVAQFVARPEPGLVWPAYALPLVAGALLGGVVAARRRSSRVRSQWA